MDFVDNPILGIDLGTTYSSIAMVGLHGRPTVIPNSENERSTPSCIFFDGDNVVVGQVAKESAKIYPESVVSFVKRSIGEPNYLFEISGKTYRPEEISSFILRKLVQDAQHSIGQQISDVVITCPAYFGINEREATKAAGEIAGLNVRQIINEPTAAAIAYGADESNNEKVVLVYDLGGGTFDITMIFIQPQAIQVICSGGDHNLGGKDWDDRIILHLVESFQIINSTNEDILLDPMTCQDLQLSAEKMKKILSQRITTAIAVTHGGFRTKIDLSRDKFEELTNDLLERTISLTKEMIDEASKKGFQQFDDILLVGGSSRMPQVAARLTQEFGKAPKLFDPEESVAKGAAILGWKMSINDSLLDRINARMNESKRNGTTEGESSSGLIQSAMKEMSDDTGIALPVVKNSNLSIQDVASKSFGIVVHNSKGEEGVFNLIKRNHNVPANIYKSFFTAEQNQDSVLIRIMESETNEEWVCMDQAVELGEAIMALSPGLPANSQVEIQFSLNVEGRLDIQAIEKFSGRRVEVTVETACVMNRQDMALAKEKCMGLRVH